MSYILNPSLAKKMEAGTIKTRYVYIKNTMAWLHESTKKFDAYDKTEPAIKHKQFIDRHIEDIFGKSLDKLDRNEEEYISPFISRMNFLIGTGIKAGKTPDEIRAKITQILNAAIPSQILRAQVTDWDS